MPMSDDVLKKNVRLFITRSFILSVYQGIYDVIFNLYILDLGFREDFLGLVLSVNMLASSIAAVPAGMLCDRYDKRRLMAIFGLLSLISTAPIFLSGSPWILLLFSAIGGACGSVSSVCATPLLTESCERDTVRVFSLNSAFSLMASIIGCTAGGLMPAIMLRLWPGCRPYRLTLALSLILLLAGLSTLLMMKSGKPRRMPNKKAIGLSPCLLKFTAIGALTGVGTGAIVPYFNVYFVKVLGASPSWIGALYAATNAIMVAGFAATPLVTSRLGKARAAALTQMASIPFLLIMMAPGGLAACSIAYAARMLLMNMAGPAITSLQMERISPDERGFAIGFMSTVSGVVVSASAYVSGLFMAHGSYVPPYAATCLAYLAAAGLMYHFFREDGHGVARLKAPAERASAAGIKI